VTVIKTLYIVAWSVAAVGHVVRRRRRMLIDILGLSQRETGGDKSLSGFVSLSYGQFKEQSIIVWSSRGC
jgi:hypothetical protein